MNHCLDHIILGCRTLDEGIAYIESLSGYRAVLGGSHPGRGTRNALLGISHNCYLEILAPDPEQNGLQWHKEIAELPRPIVVGWAEKSSTLDAAAASFRKRGIEVIGPIEGSRTCPNGDVLRWTTLTRRNDHLGILPFYIAWDRASRHPSDQAPEGCRLLDFRQTGQLMEGFKSKPGFKIAQFPDSEFERAQLIVTLAGRLGEFVLESRSVPSSAWIPADAPPL